MILPEIKEILTKELITDKALINIAGCFRDIAGTVFLLGSKSGSASEYNILGLKPWLTISSKGTRISLHPQKQEIKANPFDILRIVLGKYHLESDFNPVNSGLFGYLAYDLCRILENIPNTAMDDLNLPDLYLCAPSIILVENIKTGKILIHTIETDSENSETHDYLRNWFDLNLNNDSSERTSYSAKNMKSVFTEETYKKAVSEIKELISAGDVYQVNLSQRFEAEFKGDSFKLFKDYYSSNPASFFAYINAGDHSIVSTSPERFVSRRGSKIETRPIKGTRPRKSDIEQDEKIRQDLLTSPKDDAELSMIVDLMRNDFGRIAKPGSVKVKAHKDMESYENVHHLFSSIVAELEDGYDSVDFLKAVFPAGSITGCPKIRSMEIIDELEPVGRHIYTGSIGYIGFNDSLDLSVAIRTCVIKNEKIYFSAGGGVVFDSDPKSEYEETLHKAGTIMKALCSGNEKNEKDYLMWLNGFFMSDSVPFLRISDPGANGVGFFETIYAENGNIFFLEDHLERFLKAWNQIFTHAPETPAPAISYEDIINKLLEKNRLMQKPARVRVSVYATSKSPGYFLSILARPYVHRLVSINKRGVDTVIYDKPQTSPFAELKTISRIFYDAAGRKVSEQGADEAIILDSEGYVLETNTANIIAIKDKKVLIPPYSNRLPGVMEKNVLKILTDWGYSISEERLKAEDLFEMSSVFITNALMGAVAVLSVNGIKIISDPDFAKKIETAIRS
ncbi:aminodeoxychorismate synthase component I [Desulforegula conservatrix]|uniref:aminodeoxychorismate synthase component I n=1 Tax=Desulforegula conservatrix TaxID=153026 RepID=UPI0003F750D5|nr:aminodeoxychorismate synthase component I [Desulforegula conservatrix]